MIFFLKSQLIQDEKSVLTLSSKGAELPGSSCEHSRRRGPDNELGLGEPLGENGAAAEC